MKKLMKMAICCALALFYSAEINAAGFALYEFSARGNAMGGAVLANKAEPASIASNPALITQLEGTQVQTGLTAVIVDGSAEISGQRRDLKTGVFYLPNLYLTQQMNEHIFLGLGFFSRFGLGGEYKNPQTWTAAYATSAITGIPPQSYKMDLVTYSINPVMAAKVTDEISLAGGFEIMYAKLTEEKGPNNSMGKIEIEGDSTTWGANFGVTYNPNWAKEWVAALTYRTKTRHLATGEIRGKGAFASSSGSASAALALPDQLAFGLSFTPSERFTIEGDIMGIFWSSYKQLRVDYDDITRLPQNEYKHYKDVYRLSLGAEFALTDAWDLRAGYVYDQSPINPNFMDTMVPADNRHMFSGGLGYKIGEFGVDASYTYMFVSDLSGTAEDGQPMKYDGARSQMIGLSIKYAF
ncbi:MAG: TonB-dependent receptor [Elusimicrobiota bacterium]|jgi:long-chain fatty acid transport protein|nr:TonB-dependent receptor [Elusimicrobiota bacterium]